MKNNLNKTLNTNSQQLANYSFNANLQQLLKATKGPAFILHGSKISKCNRQMLNFLETEKTEEIEGKSIFSFLSPTGGKSNTLEIRKRINSQVYLKNYEIPCDFTTLKEKHKIAQLRLKTVQLNSNLVVLANISYEEEDHCLTTDIPYPFKKEEELERILLKNFSHEFRTPLNAIMGFAQLINSKPNLEKDKIKAYSHLIYENGKELLEVFEKVTLATQLEFKPNKKIPDSLSIADFINEVKELSQSLKKENKKEHVDLLFNISKGIPELIEVNYQSLMEIMKNLIDNAFRFTPMGAVEIGFQKVKSSFLIYVKDSGCGINEAHMPFIFDKFFKAQNDLSKIQRGLGLGLSISKQLSMQIGGKLWLDSTEGIGTTAYISLPI